MPRASLDRLLVRSKHASFDLVKLNNRNDWRQKGSHVLSFGIKSQNNRLAFDACFELVMALTDFLFDVSTFKAVRLRALKMPKLFASFDAAPSQPSRPKSDLETFSARVSKSWQTSDLERLSARGSKGQPCLELGAQNTRI